MVMGSLGAYHLYNREYGMVAFLAATFSTVTLAQLVIVLQNIRDMIYDQTAMMAQDTFDGDEEFDHPDYPIEEEDDE